MVKSDKIVAAMAESLPKLLLNEVNDTVTCEGWDVGGVVVIVPREEVNVEGTKIPRLKRVVVVPLGLVRVP
jgi:hypothetical protein